MELATYRALVLSLEEEARRDPSALRRRVYAVVALGYAYVLGILAIVVGLALATLVIMVVEESIALWKVEAVLLALAAIIVRALWVRVPPPAGVPVPRPNAPLLHDRVEEIRVALRAPRPNAILLTEDFNASVAQVPRLGIFGAPVTYLSLGLPLMYGLTPAQFDAVLAHEFGHLSASHPKRGLWVYRVGRTWGELVQHMEGTGSWALALFRRFFRWYVPRLNAYGFVMSRQDEYAADADAARVTSPAAIGGALVALATRAPVFAEDVWQRIWRRAHHEAEVPAEAWRTIPGRLRDADAEPAHRLRVEQAMQARSGDVDTHPSLHDRLRALGLVPDDVAAAPAPALAILGPLDRSAAEHYLGELAEERLAALDATWRAQAERDWHATYADMQVRRRRLAELGDLERAGETLSVEELREVLQLTAAVDGDAAALPAAERLLAADPRDAPAHFLAGSVLLDRDDEAGVAHMLEAMDLDPAAVIPGAQVLHRFHALRGDAEGKARMEERARAQHAMLVEADAERADVVPTDRFERPDLSEEVIDALQLAIVAVTDVRSVLVTRKLVRHFPERPYYVIVLRRGWLARRLGDPRAGFAQEFAERIREAIPEFLVMPGVRAAEWFPQRLLREGTAVEVRP